MKVAVSVAARRCACMDNFEFKRDIVIFDKILELTTVTSKT